MVDGDPALEYVWSPAAGLNNVAVQNPLATPAQTTQYFMTATAPALLCPEAVDSVYVYVGGVGIQEFSPGGKISIAPNPFRERFRIYIAQDEPVPCEVQITDISGKQRLKMKGSLAEINKKIETFAPSMNPGTYVLQIKSKNLRQTIQLVKIK
jgi:hypothetical protein